MAISKRKLERWVGISLLRTPMAAASWIEGEALLLSSLLSSSFTAAFPRGGGGGGEEGDEEGNSRRRTRRSRRRSLRALIVVAQEDSSSPSSRSMDGVINDGGCRRRNLLTKRSERWVARDMGCRGGFRWTAGCLF